MNVQDNLTLARFFFSTIVKRITNENHIVSTSEYISELIKEGWTIETIQFEMEQFAKDYPNIINNVYTLEQIMANKKPVTSLTEEGVFYYHNLLRETSSPSVIRLNKETGEFERVEETFFLEIKKSFSMEELLNYWYKMSEQSPNENIKKKDKGRFEFLLGYYDLDEILFAIDIAQRIRKTYNRKPLCNAFDLEKYMDEAKQEVKIKRGISKSNQINKTIER